ncbi:hypothetical protein SVIOM342S_01611 [Streptomyces violaceorubidus]
MCMPRPPSARRTSPRSSTAPCHASPVICWEPTCTDRPAGTSPASRAAASTRTVSPGGQPTCCGLSPHTAPAPPVATRQNTRAPGAWAATGAATSWRLSVAKVRMLSRYASAMFRSDLTVLP